MKFSMVLPLEEVWIYGYGEGSFVSFKLGSSGSDFFHGIGESVIYFVGQLGVRPGL